MPRGSTIVKKEKANVLDKLNHLLTGDIDQIGQKQDTITILFVKDVFF